MTRSVFAVGGDSLAQGSVGFAPWNLGGRGNWFDISMSMFGAIPGLGPRISSGIRGVQLFQETQFEWDIPTYLSWANPTSSDAFDKAIYNTALGGAVASYYGSGSTLVATAKVPAASPPGVGYAIYFVDYTGGGDWSFRKNAASYASNGQTLQHNNDIVGFYVADAFVPGDHVDMRCATAAGVAAGFLPIGIEWFYLDPATTTTGWIAHQHAMNGSKLHDLVASTSGDRMAIYDSVRLGTNLPFAPSPNRGVVLIHVNDWSALNLTQWNNDLTTFRNRVAPLGPVGFINPHEISTGSVSAVNQASYRAQTKTTAAGFSPAAKVFDIYDAWSALGFTGNTAANSAGFMYSDLVHVSQAGHFDVASRLYWWIRTQFLS